MSQNEQLLPTSVLRAIGDKLYDRRKSAALEVESLVKTLAAQGNSYRIGLIINRLIVDYAFSPQANYRKGGLLSLAAAAVALADQSQVRSQDYLEHVVPAVLNSLVDQDSRVRYYALEALFNVAKVTREAFMPFFVDTFDALFRLCADADSAVHQATTFLDNLMKDIATASPAFDLDAFVPHLREYLLVRDSKKRLFIISWVTVLASVPDLDMLAHLPQLLGGLLDSLNPPQTDPREQRDWREVKSAAAKALQEFLIDIQASQSADLNSLAAILCQRARGRAGGAAPELGEGGGSLRRPAAEGDDLIRLICMRWLHQFVCQAKPALKGRYPDILASVLPQLSQLHPDVVAEATAANRELLELPDGWAPEDTRNILAIVSAELGCEHEATRLAALHWMTTLLSRSHGTVMESLDMLLPALLDALAAPSERVAVEALRVQASIAEDERRFRHLMRLLLDRFRGPAGAKLLARRGSLVVRKLAGLLGGEKVFSALAASLESEPDLQFAASMVQALNLILLTAPEVREVRRLLAGEGEPQRGAALFQALYASWIHSAGATLTLCFLSQAYEHAAELVGVFRSVPVGVDTLVQVDRLVQVLETPVFTQLRLHLLQPALYPALLRCLYGLLMLLPQSTAFKTLHARLHCVPTLALLQLEQQAGGGGAGKARRPAQEQQQQPAPPSFQGHLDYAALLASFRTRQEQHVEAEEARKASSEADEDPGLRRVERKAALMTL